MDLAALLDMKDRLNSNECLGCKPKTLKVVKASYDNNNGTDTITVVV